LPGNNWNNPVFMSFDAWRDAPGDTESQRDFRESVARGYDIFFLRPMWIRDVAWFTSIGMGNPYKRTCAICHSVHLAGNNISPGLMDLGVNNVALGPEMPDLPVFKVTCKADVLPHPYLGREFLTHDPGRALVTGKCMDIGSLVMQQMRGMSARAPFFSNGSAKTIREVVDYYDTRFEMKMTEQEKQDLTNFMSVL
jgi:cytochrome c peroxidase